MANSIVHPTIFDVASDMESEAAKLQACIGLMNTALDFDCDKISEAYTARDHLLFLVSSLQDIHSRIDALTASSYAITRAAKPATTPENAEAADA